MRKTLAFLSIILRNKTHYFGMPAPAGQGYEAVRSAHSVPSIFAYLRTCFAHLRTTWKAARYLIFSLKNLNISQHQSVQKP
ncbi:hypothetical protein DOA83_05620 [Salmonella enterica subsp. enterica serovar Mikawasima]|uniref:Uncharacterized protein n=1 Tax=Salmonella enterica subsp. enterica serovar Mikawasima TaxID=149388 RepID=A0A5H5X5M2_SALET|nr:hypothetical protein [Salmonella enterica subsp. enterica serovar Mikawasima]EAB8695307.1 hypothetical protein [Salmonella enterica]EAA3406333.1 hypothetical protein [Salmonella enterica subsp. enterica serovar Mikawasima]EAA3753481.1 hypothetical protein [Salmonella enterica subsp. enterica serovar Mikawasima]EAA4185180.1 hypothetical protein [Salmonella enterica subsp. enterica serovar Mikawasima]